MTVGEAHVREYRDKWEGTLEVDMINTFYAIKLFTM